MTNPRSILNNNTFMVLFNVAWWAFGLTMLGFLALFTYVLIAGFEPGGSLSDAVFISAGLLMVTGSAALTTAAILLVDHVITKARKRKDQH